MTREQHIILCEVFESKEKRHVATLPIQCQMSLHGKAMYILRVECYIRPRNMDYESAFYDPCDVIECIMNFNELARELVCMSAERKMYPPRWDFLHEFKPL